MPRRESDADCLHLQLPKDEYEAERFRSALLTAMNKQPDLHRQVAKAMWREAHEVVYRRYPRALRVEGDLEQFAYCVEETFARLAYELCGDQPRTQLVERESIAVAVAALAYVIDPYVPHNRKRPQLQLPRDLPVDFDEESARQTVQALRCNAFGLRSAFREAVIDEMEHLLEHQHTYSGSQQASQRTRERLQEAMVSIDFIQGGATPGLVSQMLTQEVFPVEARGFLELESETDIQAFRIDLRKRYDELLVYHEKGISLLDAARGLEEMSRSDDLLRGLDGQWMEVYSRLVVALRPEIVLALELGRPQDMDAEESSAVRRAFWRGDKEAWRASGRERHSLDEPLSSTTENLSRHDVTPDNSVQYASESAEDLNEFEAVVSRAHLTPRQTCILHLSRSGLKQREIADRLGISEATVSEHMTKIRGRLRKTIT